MWHRQSCGMERSCIPGLMRNHYHCAGNTLGNLAQIMRHINGAYTTYVNVNGSGRPSAVTQ